MKYPFVSIILLGYNSEKDIKECIDSLKKQTYNNFEIIFVDNNSNDDSVKFIKQNYPNVKLILNKKNYGFSKGNNIGIKNSKGDYIVILNTDTILDKLWLKNLVKAAKETDYDILQSKILFFDNKRINTIGNLIHYLGYSFCGGYGKVDYEINSNVKEITSASGCCMLIKIPIFDRVGFLDEKMFMYYEDTDFSWRARLMGSKIGLVPNSIVYHKYKFSKNKNKFYFLERNRLISILKNYSLKSLLLISPALILNEVGLFFYLIKEMVLHKKIASYFSILVNFNKIMNDRRYIQKNRVINDKELLKYFNQNFEFGEINGSFQKIFNLVFRKYGDLVGGLI